MLHFYVALITLLQVGNKKAISECIILHDALYKRKIYLDAFANGLEVLGMQSMICHFPDQFRTAFVHDNSLTADAIIAKLKPMPNITRMSIDANRIWCYLLSFLRQASKEGKFIVFSQLWHLNDLLLQISRLLFPM